MYAKKIMVDISPQKTEHNQDIKPSLSGSKLTTLTQTPDEKIEELENTNITSLPKLDAEDSVQKSVVFNLDNVDSDDED